MELVTFGKELLQTVAEHVVSYRVGQTILRHLDRVLWVLEKTARWAVPPPLDQDEKPQPELVRPLPWVFFLILLVILRVARESISLVNLVMGKPPLRSDDVVIYIQSKRRYLRTLKYQGNRMMRARSSRPPQQPWYTRVQSLFEFTLCFRRYTANNNSTIVSNNEQILVVKRNKRVREPAGPEAENTESTMERLIEKMMVDLNADSDDDSSYTLTNATSVNSDAESDRDTIFNNDISSISTVNNPAMSTPNKIDGKSQPNANSTQEPVEEKQIDKHNANIPNNTNENLNSAEISENNLDARNNLANSSEDNAKLTSNDKANKESSNDKTGKDTSNDKADKENANDKADKENSNDKADKENSNDKADKETPTSEEPKRLSAKEESMAFLQREKGSPKTLLPPRKTNKFVPANGRVTANSNSKKKENTRH